MPMPQKASAKRTLHSSSTRATGIESFLRSNSNLEFDDSDSDADALLEEAQADTEHQTSGAAAERQFGGFWQPLMGKGPIFECFPDDECDNRGGFYVLAGDSVEEEVFEEGPLSKASGAFEDNSDIASHFDRLGCQAENGWSDICGQTLTLRSISYDALPMPVHALGVGVLVVAPSVPPAESCPISAEPMPLVSSRCGGGINSSSSSSGDASLPRQGVLVRPTSPLPSGSHADNAASPTKGSGSDLDMTTQLDGIMSGSAAQSLLRLRRLGRAEIS
mmetsp:Transcript_132885/g.425279  ORF Transcript_132885/g.425279 Transcript_132885/m.425279 type:complete len:276 (+) Transcript_132885:107-934(+)